MIPPDPPNVIDRDIATIHSATKIVEAALHLTENNREIVKGSKLDEVYQEALKYLKRHYELNT